MATKADDAHKHALQLMGKLIPEGTRRDAVHIAVAPVVAGMDMMPGSWIYLKPGSTEIVLRATHNPAVGIVDPYLERSVKKGDRFFMYLLPMSTTSLRHQWTHPSFGEEAYVPPGNKEESEQWLRDFCRTHDAPDYDTLMKIIAADGESVSLGDNRGFEYDYYGGHVDGEYLHVGGYDAHGEIPTELWRHAEVVLGKPLKHKPTYFSCSC